MRQIPFENEFDAVIDLFTAFGYLESDEEDQKVLHQCAKALRPHGRLVRVSFYQAPDPDNANKVINADLIFPPIIKDAFGGEIVGCGQRQDNCQKMLESLSRQNIKSEHYEWYINLRKLPTYKITSGFGLGVERFIT